MSILRCLLPLAGCCLLLPVGAIEAQEVSESVAYCLECHSDPDMTLELEDGDEMSLGVDAEGFLASAHGSELVCTDCHQGYDDFDNHPSGNTFPSRRAYVLASYEICRGCHFDTYTRALESIHFEMLRADRKDAPVCTDCHDAHEILDPEQREAMLSRSCAKCHTDVFETYLQSVHGKALHEENNDDVPTCVDCHSAHSIADARSGGFHLSSPEICVECHGDEEMMSRYDISTDVAATYLSDFHGVTATLASDVDVGEGRLVVTCVDCHGVHDITSPALLRAGEMQHRAEQVCFRCHTTAASDFPQAWLSHYRPSLQHAPLVYFVRLFYKIFIPFVVVGLALQVGMHLYRFSMRR